MKNKPLDANDFCEAISLTGYGDPKVRVMVHDRIQPDQRARFAMALIEKWGMVLARPDGEDSAGRQKIRVADSNEVVKRACEVSEFAFAAFADRGWLLNVGSYETADALAEDTN